MKKFIVIIALVALFSCSVFAANSNVGTSGFTFFKLDFSARANAMGGAYTALSNDVNAVFFNPAGLSQISEKQITTTYNSYLVGLSSGALAFSMPYEDRTIAFFSQFLTDEEDEVSSDGVITGTFDNSELLVGISASQQVHPVVFIGGSLKYLRENLAGNSASAIVFDIGVLHQTTNKMLKVGLTLKNIGTQLTYYTDDKNKETMPKEAVIGLNYFPKDYLNILLDVVKPFDDNFKGKLGVEYRYNKMLALRSGFNSNASDWNNGGKLSFISGFSTGFGLNWRKYSFDYSIKSYGDFGFNNQITLNYKF